MKHFWSTKTYLYLSLFAIKTLPIVCTSVLLSEPQFVVEPPNSVDFFNSMQMVVQCVGSSDSQISWHKSDGSDGSNWSAVGNITGLRVMRSNSLVFLPFRQIDYNSDIHSSIYRCFASNTFGTIASRNVFVRAAILQPYQISVYDEYVIRGSIAVFKCQIPSFIKEYLIITSWIRDDGFVINNLPKTGSKYYILNGDLYVIDVSYADGFSGRSYKCSARNRLTGDVQLSSNSGKLIATDAGADVYPRIKSALKQVTAEVGSDAYLVCVAQGVVSYRWLKVDDNGQTSSVTNHEDRVWLNSEILHLSNVSPQMRGKYRCFANNSVSSTTFDTQLIVKEIISVQLIVSSNKIEVGKEIFLNCSTTGSPIISLKWTKNGLPLGLDSRFKLLGHVMSFVAIREDTGCYSCRINDESESKVSSKCLYLSEDSPRFKSTFTRHILRPNDRLSLRCIAAGIPIPTIIWSIDSNPMPDNHRIQFGDYVSSNGDVVSYVNISHVRVEDSGIYECVASNSAGFVSHQQTIAVIGSPFIRQMPNISVIDGKSFAYRCPIVQLESNDPKISWNKGNKELPLNERHKVYENGTLFIRDINRESDDGKYTCKAVSRLGEEVSRDLYISVLKKPAISAFAFPSSLTSGMRVIITCSILEGDYPIKLSWLFNGQDIDSTFLDVEENSMGDMGSSLLFRRVDRKHNGDYSCLASNKAGNITHSARMIVKVPPVWKIEPNDKSVVIGDSVRFDCQSDGFPHPVIRWKVSTGTHKNEFKSVSSNYHIQCLENGSLVIKDVDKSDEGLYVCEAGNRVGVDISVVVKLSVHIGAHFKNNFQVIRVTKGNTIRVLCEAFGEKPLYIKWIRDRNDIDLISDKKYTITERHTSDGLVSELMCSSAERSDSTQFVCIAWNLYGQSEMNSQLLVEEVPDPPNGVQVVDVDTRRVALKWSIPFSGNNPISKYTIEWKRENDQWSANPYEVKGETHITVTDLSPLTKYTFRIYAINGVGKSDFSQVIATTHEEIPSKPPIDVKVEPLSSKSLKINWQPPNDMYGSVKGYYIGYKALNSDKDITFKTVDFTHNKDMEFILTALQKSTKYVITVQAFNSKGAGPQSAEVWSETFDSDPPRAPKLKILDSSDSTSVTFSWIIDEENAIRGFRVHMRRIPEEWQQYKHIIDGKFRKYKLTGLKCATNYQFYIIAFNDVGQSPASEMVSHFTNGKAPVTPVKEALISINSTFVTLDLNAWKSIGCPINYFVVQYKQYKHNEWTLVANSVLPVMQFLTINGLQSANWYHLLMSAHTDIGVTDAEYIFSTLTPLGATIAPIYGSVSEERNAKRIIVILIPISCAIIVLFVITFVVIYMFCSTKSTNNEVRIDANDWKRESMSMTAIVKNGFEANTDDFYSARITSSRDDHNYEIPFAKIRDANEYESVIRIEDTQTVDLNPANMDKRLTDGCVESLLKEEKRTCLHPRCEESVAFGFGPHSHLCSQFNPCIH